MDLSVIGNNPNLQADVAPEAKGLIKKYQENIYLSYTKWKKRYPIDVKDASIIFSPFG